MAQQSGLWSRIKEAWRVLRGEETAGTESTPEEREERRKLIEEQEAFRRVQTYSVEDAYGVSMRGRNPKE